MKTNSIFKLTILLLLIGFTLNLSARNIKGNGKVTKEVRKVASFNAIKASSGINVYLFQGSEEKVIVETDENIQDCLIVEVDGTTLKCYIDCSISGTTKLNVYVNFDDLMKIKATSGSDIYGETIIKSEDLSVNSSSGADIKIEVKAGKLSCDASSGSDIYVKGTAIDFYAEASSGADIKGKGLTTKNCKAHASSAGDISVRVTERIDADASSGGDVNFYGNPNKVFVEESSGGDVNQR